jgi:hypothetical protein
MMLYAATTLLPTPSSPPAHLIIITITTRLLIVIELAAATVTDEAAALTTTARQFPIQLATVNKFTTATCDDITPITHQILPIPLDAAKLLLLQLPKFLPPLLTCYLTSI